MTTYQVLSIDAWRQPEGWTWNNWFHAGTIDLPSIDVSDRKLINLMRVNGFLSDYSKGKVYVDDDGYNLVIANRSNDEPLFAITYGDKQL